MSNEESRREQLPRVLHFQAYRDIMDIDKVLMMSGNVDPDLHPTDILMHYVSCRLGGKDHAGAIHETMILLSEELGRQIDPGKLIDMFPFFASQIRRQLRIFSNCETVNQGVWRNESQADSGTLTIRRP